ncbi:metallophosphoesterase [Roseitranquillus sediminis]|uniref:metallophosphoesterase n=1 Tax=Roseitranquillus sediminis TaxID=2809051 RepID=UPI001D0C2072|nr:metallophosphoesterase [Roseitranquillus sediminis]MBM9594037.1 serine/threonine protein phosphatase [Roseitranquillus sediminis]
MTPTPDPGHRLYVVGDVHGRHDLLGALLPRLADDASRQSDGREPWLVLLGDLVDRGDHTRETLEIAMAAQAEWPRMVVLRGNHEAALLDFLERPGDGAAWLGFGGRQTLASYGVPVPASQPEANELRAASAALSAAMGAHVAFLERTVSLWRSGDVICAHAGIDPGLPLDAQPEKATLWGRSPFLESGPPSGLRVVHGHWDDPEPVVTPARLCLDTGAYYTGRLTAARLDAGTALIAVDPLELRDLL